MKKGIFLIILPLLFFCFVGCGKFNSKSMMVELEISSANNAGFVESNFIKDLEEEISKFVMVDFESLSEMDIEVLIACLKSKWGVDSLVKINLDKTNHTISILLGEGETLFTSKSSIMLPLSDCKA